MILMDFTTTCPPPTPPPPPALLGFINDWSLTKTTYTYVTSVSSLHIHATYMDIHVTRVNLKA